MIVSRETFQAFISTICLSKDIAVDTETEGLFPYKEHNLFSIIFATEAGQWYLNFQEYKNCPPSLVLDKTHISELQERIFNEKNRRYFFHNAKFDLAFLAKLGIECRGHVHDTASIHRIINNEAFLKFSLENCAKVLDVSKSDMVELFIQEHGLYELVQIPGKKQRQTNKFFHQVPLDIISNYGLKDGEITYRLGTWQLSELRRLEHTAHTLKFKGYIDLYKNEVELTKTVYEMEKRGVLIDVPYVASSILKKQTELFNIEESFKLHTGETYKESAKLFEKVFQGEAFVYGEVTKTGKRNASFDSSVLETFKNPASKMVLAHRDCKSKLDFLQGFLFFADKDNILHTNFNPGGTVTGRFSSNNPNLQNLEKTEGEDLNQDVVIRRAIIPRPGFFFAMFDYDQMEYRMMLDMAEAHGLIEKIKGGLDVHQATADAAKITRSQAKTVNFGLLYGQGDDALAASLKTTREDAYRLRRLVFDSAPEVEEFIESQKYLAETRGYIVNWFGRRNHFPLLKTEYGMRRMIHKAANSVIQGGCADVVKIAMNKIHRLLSNKQSKLVLTIHDELVIETHESERGLLPEIKNIMETVYPHRYLPLTVGCEHSFKSLADKTEGFPA